MAASESTIVIDELEPGDSKSQEHPVEGEDEEVTEQLNAVTQEQAEEEWNQLTVAQLKEELVYRELSTAGKKADLVARLLAHEFEMEGHNMSEEAERRHNEDEVEHDEDEEQPEEEQGGEVDEDNGDGVEFVEWNEGDDADRELVEGGEDISEDAMVVAPNESQEDGENKEAAGTEKSTRRDVTVEEGDIKAENEEYSVDVSKERDLFTLNWHGKRLTVPFRNEILKDLEVANKIQSVVVYPVELADVYSDTFRKHMEKATETTLKLEEMKPGKPAKGLLKMRFISLGEALDAIEELKSVKEGMTVKHFCPEDSEDDILIQLHREEFDRKGTDVCCLLYVGNLPSHVTERSIKEAFPDALQVIIPYDEETMERIGYAYLEYKNEENAYEASEKYKDIELEGEKLYVIKALAVNKDKFGLIRDTLRLYWAEQILKLRKIIDRSHGRGSWEVADAEQKMNALKRRLDKDKRRREELRLPIPDLDEKRKEDKSDDKDRERDSERRQSRERRRSSHHSLKDSERKSSSHRLPPRRSPFVRRDSFRTGRGGRGTGYMPRSEEATNKLVNKLQGLVTALTSKFPDAGSSAHPPPHHHPHPMQRRHYPDEPRYPGGQGRPSYTRPSNYYDDNRSGATYHSNYMATSYEQSYPSYRGGYRENPADRYSAKRYRDDDGYGPERKKRLSAVGGGYMDQGSSSRYTNSRVPYSVSNRRGGGTLSAGRPYGRSKPRGSYNY